MKYIKVKWKHVAGEEKEPLLLYSEIDDQGWEVRKVDLYEDGHYGYADKSTQVGDTGLGLEPIPLLKEMNAQDSFDGVEITKEEFEQVWKESHL